MRLAPLLALLLAPVAGAQTVTAAARARDGSRAIATASMRIAPELAGALHRPWMVYSYTDFYFPHHAADSATLKLVAARTDRLTNGSPVAWRTFNPTIEQYEYRLFYSVLDTKSDSAGIDGVHTFTAWLTAHGYPIESAFLHMKDSTVTPAHRLTWFLQHSNGDSSTALNPADPGFRAYQLAVLDSLRAEGYAGVFYDIFGRGSMARLFKSAEGDSTWFIAQITDALKSERAASGERITINIGSYRTAFDSLCVMAAGGVHLELTNYPPSYNLSTNFNWWSWIDRLVAGGAQRIEFVSNLAWYDKVPQASGNDASPMAREKMAEYVSYLMAKDTGAVLSFAPDNYWNESPAAHWLAAWDTDIGRPLGPRAEVTSGTDVAGQHYQVWTRRFQRAELVMRVNAYPTVPTNFADSTAVAVPLGSPGRLLRSDGTTVPADTVRLLAGEGVVVLTP